MMTAKSIVKTALVSLVLIGNLVTAGETEKKFPPVGLVGYWDFNEGKGDVVHDRARWIGDMKMRGGPKWIKNASGYCMLFDNKKDGEPVFLRLPSHRPFRQFMTDGSTIYNQVTISMWIQLIDKGYVPAKRNFGCLFYSTFIIQENHIQFNVNGKEMGLVFRLQAPKPERGKWTHIAGTWDGNIARLYVDGKLVRQKGGEAIINTVSPPQGKPPFRFGLVYPWFKTGRYKGYVDELKFFSRALTADEIKKEYDASREKVKINQ